MAKKLYLNTKSTPLTNIHIINNAAIINYNEIIGKPPNIIKDDYSYVSVSSDGLVSTNIDINNFYTISSFIFSCGGKPRILETKTNNNYYESKLSEDLSINNTILIG